jgi:hypothetical protein
MQMGHLVLLALVLGLGFVCAHEHTCGHATIMAEERVPSVIIPQTYEQYKHPGVFHARNLAESKAIQEYQPIRIYFNTTFLQKDVDSRQCTRTGQVNTSHKLTI